LIGFLFADGISDATINIPSHHRAPYHGRIKIRAERVVDPDDLIPDRVPGLGYLDDAIMVELVVQELRHEIDAYDDFCAFRTRQRKERSRHEVVGERLEARRVALQSRMRRRRRDERTRRRTRTRSRSPISLW